jgi:hypothetical protein
VHTDRLDLCAQRSAACQPGQEAQLQRADDWAGDGDDQQVRRIGVDSFEGSQVGLQRFGVVSAVPCGPELVGGEETNNRWHVVSDRRAQDHRGAVVNRQLR